MFLACIAVGINLPALSANAGEAPDKRGEFTYVLQSDFNTSSKTQDIRNTFQYAQQQSKPSVSPSQAKSIALRRNPGARFIDVQLRGNQYRVRLQLKNGRIKDVYVDARRR